MKEKIKLYVYGLGKVVLIPFNWIFLLFEKIVDYTGPFAAILKGLPVAAMAILIFSPWIVYWLILIVARSAKPPLSYLLYVLWWSYVGLLIAGGAFVGYLMETKSSSWWGPKSVEYQRQRTNRGEWNIDETIKEYMEVLEKQKKR